MDRARLEEFGSLVELRDAVDVVAVLHATPEHRFEVIGESFRITTMRVQEVLSGSLPGDTVAMRQLGEPTGKSIYADRARAVEPDRTYLAFLVQAFPDDPALAHLYGPADGIFIFERVGDSFRRMADFPDPLPSELTLEFVRRELAR